MATQSVFDTLPNASVGYKTAMNMFKQAAAQYAPEGSYTKGVEAMLARLSKTSQAQGMANLASSGLANTTLAAGIGNRFAEEVAAPQLAQAESQRAQSLSEIYNQGAQFAGQYADRPKGGGGMASNSRLQTTYQNPSEYLQTPIASETTTPSQKQTQLRGLTTYNIGTPVGSASPLTSAAASDQNWAIVNGQKFTQNANGDWNIPTGFAAKANSRTLPSLLQIGSRA